tara:strand:- start:2698 stop:5007 length:2310 start_codon:yes stop_codon:yes gene_type:complete
MVRLVAYDSNNNPTELDLFGGETIPLTLNVDDLREVGNRNGGYSKDFDLPFTKVNNKFFNHIYDLQVDSTYNPFTNLRAELYINENLVFAGGLYLQGFVDKDAQKHYTVNLFSNTVRLLDSLGEATLNDLDYSDLDHTFTEANVLNSQTSTGVTLTAGGTTTNVFYPLTQTKGILTDNAGLRIISSRNYTPFVSLKYILDKIFAFAGFAYRSDFFNTATFTDIYTDTGLADFSSNASFDYAAAYTGIPYADVNWQSGSDDFNIIDAIQDPELAITSNNTYQSATGGAPTSHKTSSSLFIPYVKVINAASTNNNVNQESGATGLQDPSNIYNIGIITAPTDNFEFELLTNYYIYGAVGTNVTLSAVIGSGSSTNTIVLSSKTIQNNIFFTGLTNAFDNIGVYDFYTLNLQNDTFSLQLEASADIYLMPYKIGYDMSQFLAGGCGIISNGIPDSCGIEFYDGIHRNLYPTEVYINPIAQNGSIDDRIKNNHTDIKLKDIFSDITKIFNLYVDTTENDKELKIEPYNDYVAAGTTLNWTEKADYTQVVSAYEDLPSVIEFMYNNDEDDYALNQYKKNAGVDYGSFKLILNTDKKQEEKIELDVFSATAVVHYSTSHPYSSVVQRDEAGVFERLKNNPRLLYKNFTPIGVPTDDLINIVDHTSYHMASHYNDTPANINATTLDLNFGFTQPVYIANSLNTIKNLFNTYYYRYILERYTEDRTFIKINIRLSETDIANFRFNNKVRLKNQTYLVNKIEYNAGENGISKVELVKI